MDESILQRLNNVDLQADEVACVVLDNQDIDEGLKEADLSVWVHLPGGKQLNLEGFKVAMGKAWQCGSFSIQKIDDRFYQVFFGTQETVDFVLNQGPWNFENSLVMVRPFHLGSGREDLDLSKEYFWMLLTGLPRICYTLDVAKKLVKVLDSCTNIQLREDQALGTKYFRFRCLIDITKPLKRLLRIATPDGGNSWWSS